MNDEALTTYLNDHLAGSEAGRALAERCAASNPATPLASFLQSLVAKIEDEQGLVKDLVARSGGEVNTVKAAVGWLGEKASRIKLDNPLQSYTALNRLEQIEGLVLGVRGKKALWDALGASLPTDPRFTEIDFDELSANAEQQLAELEQYRLAAAHEAFEADTSGA